jgi:hypothetical protein
LVDFLFGILSTHERQMENGSRLDVPDDLREPRLAKAEQLRGS